jgi:hypothetical protein
MKSPTGKTLWIVCALLTLALAGGCSTASKTYLLNFGYSPAAVDPFIAITDKPVTVAVYQFEDVRPDRIFLGRRVYPDGTADFYKSDAGTVEQVVTKSMVRLLEKAGFRVVTVNRYLDPEKIEFKDVPGDAAFGGKIETLWVEAKKSSYQLTDTNAQIKLAVAWGFAKDGTWVRKMIEGSGKETRRPWYQPENAEDMINDVFKDSLNKLLRDEQSLKEKLTGGR